MELIANGIGNKTREGCPQRCTKNCSSGLMRAAASCFSAARVSRRRAAFPISARRTDCIISSSPIRQRKFCPTPFFARHPEEFYRFYRAKMLPLDAQPNDAHRFLAQLEAGGRLTAVITQNIDGLHQKAGSKTVLELHGSIHRNYCLKCARFFPPEYIRDSEGVPKCPCGGIIKPDVVLYEEGLDDATVRAAVRQLQQAELLIVAGTSLTVYPAASLLRFFRGRHIVLINRDATPLDNQADLVLHERVGEVCRHLRPTPLEVGE